jgi:hypothetical protein
LRFLRKNLLRDAFPPPFPPSREFERSKDLSLYDRNCHRPLIERSFDPFWNGQGSDVAALADQIHDCPAPCRICTSSNSKPTSSDPRTPQPNSIASIA